MLERFFLAALAAFGDSGACSSFGRLVETHANALFARGYALEISMKDFDHGHLLLSEGSPKIYDFVCDIFPNVAAVVYHTDEMLGLPGFPHKHREKSRSIAGFNDGSIAPLEELLDMSTIVDTEDYREHKTIHPVYMARQYSGMGYFFAIDENPELRSAGELNCEIHLVPDETGCFSAGGARFNIFLSYYSGSGFLYKKLPCSGGSVVRD